MTTIQQIGGSIVGFHISFLGFVVLWFNQQDLGGIMTPMEILGWAIVLGGVALSLWSFVSAQTT
jgi:hypothetical protein